MKKGKKKKKWSQKVTSESDALDLEKDVLRKRFPPALPGR